MNLRRPTPAEARKLVEQRLGKISDAVWKFAVDERMVAQFQEEQKLDWLTQKIQELVALGGTEKPTGYIEVGRRQRRTQRIPSRQEAISGCARRGAGYQFCGILFASLFLLVATDRRLI